MSPEGCTPLQNCNPSKVGWSESNNIYFSLLGLVWGPESGLRQMGGTADSGPHLLGSSSQGRFDLFELLS